MPDSNKPQQESQPLFGQHDILHDIETVQAKWAREQVRRRALMVKVFIVGGILLCLALGSVIYKIHKQAQYRLSLEEQEQRKYLPIGYRDAKIHMIIYEGDSSGQAEELLREAVDNKPSEFYVEFKNLAGVDGDEVVAALGNFRPGITINGKYEFKIKDENGEEKVVKLLDDPGYMFKIKELGIIINQVHAQLYGDSYLQPITSQFGYRTQSIPIEGLEEAETAAEAAKKTHGHDHDHDHDKDKEEKLDDDMNQRISISPAELKVPKLDAVKNNK